MKDTNYYTTYGWMYNKLKLDTTSVAVYSIIYGFTKGEEKECSCSFKYFAESINRTKQTIVNILKKMVANGIVILRQERADDGGQRNYYRANLKKLKELGIEKTESHHRIQAEKPKNFTPSVKKTELPQSKNQNGGSQIFRPDSNTPYNTLSDNSTTAPPDKKFGKHKNVILSEKEYNELSNLYENLFAKKLENLSRTLARYDKAYTINKISHYAIIKSWCEMEKPKAERTFNSNTYRQPYKSNVHEDVRTTDTPYRQTTMQEDYERIMADFARLGGAC